MAENKNLHELDLHETIIISNDRYQLNILRVPGGWIYSKVGKDHPGTFVPFDKEFRGVTDKFFVK